MLIKRLIVLCSLYSVLCTLCYAKAQHSFDNMEKLFLEGKYDKAVAEADALIDDRASRRDEIYYLKGLSEIKLKRFIVARQSLEHALSAYPDSKIKFDMHVAMGDAYFLEGNTHSAIRIYKEVLAKFPGNSNISAVQKKLAECNERLGKPGLLSETLPKENLTSPPKGVISVQVGSFISRGNAAKLARNLSRKGYDSYVEPPSVSRTRFYRVKVGRCSSMEEAQGLASRLKRSGYSIRICTDDKCQ